MGVDRERNTEVGDLINGLHSGDDLGQVLRKLVLTNLKDNGVVDLHEHPALFIVVESLKALDHNVLDNVGCTALNTGVHSLVVLSVLIEEVSVAARPNTDLACLSDPGRSRLTKGVHLRIGSKVGVSHLLSTRLIDSEYVHQSLDSGPILGRIDEGLSLISSKTHPHRHFVKNVTAFTENSDK